MSNFFFHHNVFKSRLLQRYQKEWICGKLWICLDRYFNLVSERVAKYYTFCPQIFEKRIYPEYFTPYISFSLLACSFKWWFMVIDYYIPWSFSILVWLIADILLMLIFEEKTHYYLIKYITAFRNYFCNLQLWAYFRTLFSYFHDFLIFLFTYYSWK